MDDNMVFGFIIKTRKMEAIPIHKVQLVRVCAPAQEQANDVWAPHPAGIKQRYALGSRLSGVDICPVFQQKSSVIIASEVRSKMEYRGNGLWYGVVDVRAAVQEKLHDRIIVKCRCKNQRGDAFIFLSMGFEVVIEPDVDCVFIFNKLWTGRMSRRELPDGAPLPVRPFLCRFSRHSR